MTDVKTDERPVDTYVPSPMRVISPSGFNTYKECPRKFWITYGPLGKREPGSKHTFRGSLVHQVAEELWDFEFDGPKAWQMQLRNEAQRLFDLHWSYNEMLHVEGNSFKMETQSMVDNHVDAVIRKLGGQFDATPKYGVKGNWKIIKPKIEEDYRIEDEDMRGRVDELIEVDDEEYLCHDDWLLTEMDELVISDLKSSKIFKIAYSAGYKRQIHYYAMLHKLKYGKVPKYGCIKFLRYGQEAYFEIDPEYVDRIYTEVKALQEKCDKDRDDETEWIARTDYKFCAWCPWNKDGTCKEGTEKHNPLPEPLNI